MQQSILLPSSKFGITPPVVNIGAWQCACGLCLQDFSMQLVVDRKWRCAQQSLKFLATEGDLDNRSQASTGNQCPLVAENQRQIICCPRNYWSQLHSLSVGLSHLQLFSASEWYLPFTMSPHLKDWPRVERRLVPATAVCLADLVGCIEFVCPSPNAQLLPLVLL